jgi:hypothetical protein
MPIILVSEAAIEGTPDRAVEALAQAMLDDPLAVIMAVGDAENAEAGNADRAALDSRALAARAGAEILKSGFKELARSSDPRFLKAAAECDTDAKA